MLELRGIFPALATPRHEDESLDLDGLRVLVRHLLEAGVHGIFAAGTTGEGFALSLQEREQVVGAVVDEVGDRAPVIAGAGGDSTATVIQQCAVAAGAGANAICAVTPSFIHPSQEEEHQHYRNIAGASPVPVLVYHHPRVTHNPLEPETILRIAALDNVAGMKESSGDLNLALGILADAPETFAFFGGHDSLILSVLEFGARGAIAATANIAPRLLVELYEAFCDGDLPGARRAQRQVARLRQCFALGSPPVVTKEALRLLGLPAGPCASPMGRLGPQAWAELVKLLREVGLLA